MKELRQQAAAIAKREKDFGAGNNRTSALIKLLAEYPRAHEQVAILNAYEAAK